MSEKSMAELKADRAQSRLSINTGNTRAFYIQQMNNGHWYVVRAARYCGPTLRCENAGWATKRMAEQALARDLETGEKS